MFTSMNVSSQVITESPRPYREMKLQFLIENLLMLHKNYELQGRLD